MLSSMNGLLFPAVMLTQDHKLSILAKLDPSHSKDRGLGARRQTVNVELCEDWVAIYAPVSFPMVNLLCIYMHPEYFIFIQVG